jgi:ABC-type lipoprotein release transport system permease subunit
MEFVELKNQKPRDHKESSSSVRINFNPRKRKNGTSYILAIRIGKEVAESLDIKLGDKVSFAYNKDNKRVWLLKKSDKGFKVGGRFNVSCFIIQITWNPIKLYKPEEFELNTHSVHNEIYEGGLKIDTSLIQ